MSTPPGTLEGKIKEKLWRWSPLVELIILFANIVIYLLTHEILTSRWQVDSAIEIPVEKSTVLTRLPKVLFCQIRWNLNVCKNRDFFLL